MSISRLLRLLVTSALLGATAVVAVPGAAQAATSGCLTATGSASPASPRIDTTVSLALTGSIDPSCLDELSYESFELRAGIGSASTVVSSVPAGAQYDFSSTVQVRAPQSPGQYAVRAAVFGCYWWDEYECDALAVVVVRSIQVVDDNVYTLGGATASSTRVYQGYRTRIAATAYKTLDGVRSTRVMAGYATLEFRAKGSSTWVQLQNRFVGTTVASFSTVIKRTGYFRVRDLKRNLTSAAVQVRAVPITNTYRVGTARIAATSVVKGTKVGVRATVTVRYADGVWKKAPVGTAFVVKTRAQGSTTWRSVVSGRTTSVGLVKALVRAERTGSWRVHVRGATGGTDFLTVVPRAPARVKAYWPSTIWQYQSWTVKGEVIANDGTSWGGTVKLVLQYRASRFDPWKNIDYDYQDRYNYAVLIAPSGEAGYWRVYAPSLGMQTSTLYS